MSKYLFTLLFIILLLAGNNATAQSHTARKINKEWKSDARKKKTHFRYNDIYSNRYWGYTLGKDNINCTYGLLKDTTWAIPPIYDDISMFIGKYVIVTYLGKMGVIDSLNNTIIPFEYQNLHWAHVGYQTDTTRLIFGSGYKVGMIDINNDTIIPPIYQTISKKMDDSIYMVRSRGKYGVIVNDSLTIKPKYWDMDYIHNGMFVFQKRHRIGIIDTKDKKVLPAKYKSIYDKYGGEYLISKGLIWPKYGLYDIMKDTMLIKTKYTHIEKTSHGYYLGFYHIYKRKKKGVYIRGQIKIKPKYTQLNNVTELLRQHYSFKEQFTAYKKGRWGLIDENDSIIIPFKFDEELVPHKKYGDVNILRSTYKDYNNGSTKLGGYWMFADSNWNIVHDSGYTKIEYDFDTKTFIASKYDYRSRTIDTYDSNLVFIDRKIKLKRSRYDAILLGGLYVERKLVDSSYYIYYTVTDDGTQVSENKYNQIKQLYSISHNGRYNNSPYNCIRKGNRFGIMWKDGKELFPCVYDAVGFSLDSNYVLLVKNDTVYKYQDSTVKPFTSTDSKLSINLYSNLNDGYYSSVFMNGRGKVLWHTFRSHQVSISNTPNQKEYYYVSNHFGNGILDSNLNFVIGPSDSFIFEMIGKDYLRVKDRFNYHEQGIADMNGKIIIMPDFRYIRKNAYLDYYWAINFAPGDSNLVRHDTLILDGKWHLFDLEGNKPLEFSLDEEVPLNHLIHIPIADKSVFKYKVVDSKGNTVIPAIYSEINSLNCGLYYVKDSLYWGILDSAGNTMYECKFLKISPPINEIIGFMTKDKKWGFMNTNGEILVNPEAGTLTNYEVDITQSLNQRKYMITCDTTNGHIFCRFKNDSGELFSSSLVHSNHPLKQQLNNFMIELQVTGLATSGSYSPTHNLQCLRYPSGCYSVLYSRTSEYGFNIWYLGDSFFTLHKGSYSKYRSGISHHYYYTDSGFMEFNLNDIFNNPADINPFLAEYLSTLKNPLHYCTDLAKAYQMFIYKFEISNEGLVFYFEDDLSYTLPYSKIKHLVKPNCPIAELIK